MPVIACDGTAAREAGPVTPPAGGDGEGEGESDLPTPGSEAGDLADCEQVQESCNGKDDDCDGAVDEGPAPIRPDDAPACGPSLDCAGLTEVGRCVDGAWVCERPLAEEDPETTLHDGVDNDCDGEIDEACHDVLHTIENDPAERPGMGVAVAGVGDLDGDGADDWLVSGDASRGGRVQLRSGMDFRVLHERSWGPDEGGSGWTGFSLGRAGDVNGDGAPDVLVGEARRRAPQVVRVLSGADGETITRLEGAPYVDEFYGSDFALADDLDEDGVREVVVAAALTVGDPFRDDWPPSLVHVRSPVTGEVLVELEPPRRVRSFGLNVAVIGDTDGDGTADVAVSALRDMAATSGKAARVFLYSGADGRLLRELQASPIHRHTHGVTHFTAVAPAGDLDGDGAADLFVGELTHRTVDEWGDLQPTGRVRAYSGGTGALLWEHVPDPATGVRRAGVLPDHACDFDGDGLGDVVVGAPHSSAVPPDQGAAFILSGRTGTPIFQPVRMPGSKWLGGDVAASCAPAPVALVGAAYGASTTGAALVSVRPCASD